MYERTIRCELKRDEQGTLILIRGEGCTLADAEELCRPVAAGDPVVRHSDPGADPKVMLGRLLWLGDELPLAGNYADLVVAAESGDLVGGRVRCEVELLPGGTVTVFRSPACTTAVFGDLCIQVIGESARVRDVTPGARCVFGGAA